MLYFDLVLSFSALFCICAFFTIKAKLHSALAPLVSLACIACLLTVAGTWDVLRPAGWAVYLACWGLGIFALATGTKQEKQALISPGMLLFWALSIGFAVYFALRQPIFTEYDEFTFWAPAAQMTKTTDRLYTVGETGTPWQASQNPGLILIGYFVQFFGQFAPFKVYLGYDMLLFACFAALLGRVEFKNYRLAVPLAVVGFCTPWFFTVYARTIEVNKVYMSAYGDIPAGVLIGGTAALWFALRAGNKPVWPILPVLALLANIKDNIFPLALVTAALIAADYFLFGYETRFKTGAVKRFGFSTLCMVVPFAQYRWWSSYIAKLVAQNAASGGMGTTSDDPISVAINGTKLLLGLSVPEKYTQGAGQFYSSIQKMTDAFFNTKFSMIGSGVVVVALILLVFFAAFLFSTTLRQRLRVVMWAVCSTLGFLAHSYVLALSYGFIFKEFQAVGLTDYNRYMYPYYIGWFMMAVALLALTAQTGRWRNLCGAGVLGLAVVTLVRVNMMVLPQLSVLGFSDAEFTDQYAMQQRVAAVRQTDDDARIFIVTQGDNGIRWFMYSTYFLPQILDYSGDVAGAGGGGGTFGLPEFADPDSLYYHAYTAEQLRTTILESGCSYIFMDKLDDTFVKSYAELFSDGLAAALAGETLLYAVVEGQFAPVAMEVVPQ